MRIALLSSFEEPVPPKMYGGTERIVYTLAEEWVKMGHDVTLYASGDSQTTAKLVPCTSRAIRVLKEARHPATRQGLNLQALVTALLDIRDTKYDIIHNHFGCCSLRSSTGQLLPHYTAHSTNHSCPPSTKCTIISVRRHL
jgi:hypothetical protein